MSNVFEIPGPTSPLAVNLTQRYLVVPSFTLESGEELRNVPIAFKTWGELNSERNNAVLVCHPISGHADTAEWWSPLFGDGKVLDPSKYFVVSCNAIGSPYGSLSPLTRKGGEDIAADGTWTCSPHVHAPMEQDTQIWWGSDLPHSTIRDDVHLQKIVLDYLGIEQLALVTGGSMGGCTSLEWPLCYPVKQPASDDALTKPFPSGSEPYVKAIAILAAPPHQSAWCISWCEIQRKTIEADTRYQNGHYLLREPPNNGLAAARMCALLTYRQPHSFERRFSRLRGKENLSGAAPKQEESQASSLMEEGGDEDDMGDVSSIKQAQAREQYAVQSYLHHHGAKFIQRFDANCYIHLSDKLDAYDVARDRNAWVQKGTGDNDTLRSVLQYLGTSPVAPHVLIASVTSDMLYTPEEQQLMHECIPHSELVKVESAEGHDGFLIEYPQIAKAMQSFLDRIHLPHPAATATAASS